MCIITETRYDVDYKAASARTHSMNTHVEDGDFDAEDDDTQIIEIY
jgi:hypothetical protein